MLQNYLLVFFGRNDIKNSYEKVCDTIRTKKWVSGDAFRIYMLNQVLAMNPGSSFHQHHNYLHIHAFVTVVLNEPSLSGPHR